ncbi:MAG: ABC transporter permease [Cytophagaceae bacterium]|nr:ABC transporter permease [Cytophagaceae bacterium]
MSLYYFISKRINKGKKGSFSAIVANIAVMSVAFGLFVMIISFSILDGFKNKIQAKIFSFGSHLQITMSDTAQTYEETPISLNSQLYRHPEAVPEIDRIHAVAHNLGLLKKKTSDEFTGAVLKGVGKDFDIKGFEENIIEGSFITFKEDTVENIDGMETKKRRWSEEVVISKRIANKMDLKVRDKVFMFFMKNDVLIRPLQVKGIYETGLEEFDELMIIGDIKMNQTLNKWPDSLVGGYEIFVKDFSRLDQAYEKVFDAMDPEMGIESIKDKFIQIFDWLAMVDKNVVIFLFIILFIACVNMVSTILIMILERTNMIGMLKALGARNGQVQMIFFYNGMNLILRGMFLGNLFGIGFCLLQYYLKIIPLDPENYYMTTVPIDLDWMVVLALNVLTFLLISLVLLIPIIVISNIKPIRAIKFD